MIDKTNCNHNCGTCSVLCAKDQEKLEYQCEMICRKLKIRYGLNVNYAITDYHVKFKIADKHYYTTHKSNVLSDLKSCLEGILELRNGNEPECQNCCYGKRELPRMVCRRFPQPINHASTDWCGEFKKRND